MHMLAVDVSKINIKLASLMLLPPHPVDVAIRFNQHIKVLAANATNCISATPLARS